MIYILFRSFIINLTLKLRKMGRNVLTYPRVFYDGKLDFLTFRRFSGWKQTMQRHFCWELNNIIYVKKINEYKINSCNIY